VQIEGAKTIMARMLEILVKNDELATARVVVMGDMNVDTGHKALQVFSDGQTWGTSLPWLASIVRSERLWQLSTHGVTTQAQVCLSTTLWTLARWPSDLPVPSPGGASALWVRTATNDWR
jgi:hypothetical protein